VAVCFSHHFEDNAPFKANSYGGGTLIRGGSGILTGKRAGISGSAGISLAVIRQSHYSCRQMGFFLCFSLLIPAFGLYLCGKEMVLWALLQFHRSIKNYSWKAAC
jgi:hypothetical protein